MRCSVCKHYPSPMTAEYIIIPKKSSIPNVCWQCCDKLDKLRESEKAIQDILASIDALPTGTIIDEELKALEAHVRTT